MLDNTSNNAISVSKDMPMSDSLDRLDIVLLRNTVLNVQVFSIFTP